MLNTILQPIKDQLDLGTLKFDISLADLTDQLQQVFSTEFVQLEQAELIEEKDESLHFRALAPSLLGVSFQNVEGIFFVHNGQLEFW